MKEEIQQISLNESIDTCPVCGYTDGFHASFKVFNSAIAVILIVPNVIQGLMPVGRLNRLAPSSLEEES